MEGYRVTTPVKTLENVVAQDQIQEHLVEQAAQDFVSLKSAYRKLFQKIIVNPLGTAKVNLKFIFNNIPTSPNGGVDANCILNWMVEQGNLYV